MTQYTREGIYVHLAQLHGVIFISNKLANSCHGSCQLMIPYLQLPLADLPRATVHRSWMRRTRS